MGDVETYEELLVRDESGEMTINPRIDEQCARLDTLSPEEELELLELDQRTEEAETCPLSVGDRILHDRGEELGYSAGRVVSVDESGRFSVKLDGERQELVS